MSQPLFLYGTLLPGLAITPIDDVIARLTSLGLATVAGRLYDLGPYPGLILDSTFASAVVGELFALPDDPAVLATLDDYEDYDPVSPDESLLRRVPCLARTAVGVSVACWVYEYNRDVSGAVFIANGDYRQWHASRVYDTAG